MTRITIENGFGKYIVEDNKYALDIYETIDLFERALLASSFGSNTIKDGFISKSEEYEENIN